jgi:hypothetical protein
MAQAGPENPAPQKQSQLVLVGITWIQALSIVPLLG